MVHTEIAILEYVSLSQEEVSFIYEAATDDCIAKLTTINEDFNPNQYRFSYEVVCRVTVTKK